jgi:PIN domain nuclease of toxin-antitoxin system
VRRGLRIEEVRSVIGELPLSIVTFDDEQIYPTAVLHSRTRAFGLSLSDCVCLNLAATRGLPALTTEKLWSEAAPGIEVRVIR